MIFLGIDNGLTGAVAILPSGEGGEASVYPTPVTTFDRGKKRRRILDLWGMWILLQNINETHLGVEGIFCALEAAQAFPGQGVVSVAHYMHGHGAWEMALVAAGISYQRVHPATWKREMFKDLGGKGKGAAVIAAHRLFPGVSLLPSPEARKDSDGMAEALLLAEYARRTWGRKDT